MKQINNITQKILNSNNTIGYAVKQIGQLCQKGNDTVCQIANPFHCCAFVNYQYFEHTHQGHYCIHAFAVEEAMQLSDSAGVTGTIYCDGAFDSLQSGLTIILGSFIAVLLATF
eukprot:403361246